MAVIDPEDVDPETMYIVTLLYAVKIGRTMFRPDMERILVRGSMLLIPAFMAAVDTWAIYEE